MIKSTHTNTLYTFSPLDSGARGRLAAPDSSLLTVRSASAPPLLFSMQVYTVDPETHTYTIRSRGILAGQFKERSFVESEISV